jgi:hypothetical protein
MAGADLTFQEVVNLQIAAALPSVRRGAVQPGNGELPYIQFGQSNVSDDFAPGESVDLEVHVWSKAEGPHEVKNYQHAIKAVLQKCSHERGGYRFTAVRQNYASTFLDVDGETWHGVQRFRARVHAI